MTAPRAITRTISDAMRRTLIDMSDAIPRETSLFKRIGRVLQDDTASEAQAVALIEQAKRAANPRPNPDAVEVAELARRADPTRDGRTRGWSPEQAKATRERSAVATVLDGVEVDRNTGTSAGGGRVAGEAKSTVESRAAAREERSRINRAEAEERRQAIAALGKNPDPAAVAEIDRAYEAKRAARTGGAGRSIAAQSGAVGTGPKAEAKAAAAAARSQVNADLRAKKIDAAEAEKRYAIIKQQEKETLDDLAQMRGESDLNTQTKIGDAADMRDGHYYDVDNPEAKDRPIISGTRKRGMKPGGLNEGVVTASAVVRRHINEMVASGAIPSAPPDAAMPNILRTAMKELRIDDSQFDDFALMRAYRQQARRGSAFSRRRGESTDPLDLPPASSIDEAGERAGLKMLEGIRGGRAARAQAEEGFVDDAAAMLAEGDAFEEGVVSEAGPTGRQLARAAQEATMVPPPAEAGFRERESFRRGRGRAERVARQFDQMDEGAGEYAIERNEKVAKRRAAGPAGPAKPREFFLQDELGPVVQPRQSKKSIVPGAGLVRDSGDQSVIGRGDFARENMMLRERTGEREQVFPRRGVPSRFTGLEDGSEMGNLEPILRRGAGAVEPREDPNVVMREIADENTAMLGMVADGTLTKEQAAGYMLDNMRRLERTYESINTPPSEFAAARGGIEDQANQEVDGLVRMLMDRVSRMPQGEQDQFFGAVPGGFDQQRILNRDRSRTLGQTMRQEVDYRGEPLDYGRPGAMPFPSTMGRQFPQEQNVESIVARILAAINAGQ